MRISRKKLVLAAAATLAAVAGVAPVALAKDMHAIALTSPRATGSWTGSVTAGATPDPGACTPDTCDSVPIDVRLGRRASQPTRAMLVAIDWSKNKWLEPGYDLNLYVYDPHGRLAGKSDSLVDSHAEAVWVQHPVNGRYIVQVVPHNVADAKPLAYRGFVNFARGRTFRTSASALGQSQTLTYVGAVPRRRRAMLPDLVPGRPSNFHIATGLAASFYVGAYHGVEHQPSCYPQELTGADEDHPSPSDPRPTRCLRFDSQLINLGAGPYEIRVYPDDNDSHAYQVLYDSAGHYTERPVGASYFSSAHGHFHYTGFEETGLYSIRRNGMPGRMVSRLQDKGRCATDTGNPLFGRAGNGPPRYQFPRTCDTNDNSDPHDPVHPGSRYFRNGVSPGWDDTYSWWILDQYIDISHVPDGRYLVVYRVNTLGHIRETTSGDNTSVACVAFHGTTVHTCRLPKAAVRLGRNSVLAVRSHPRLGARG